MHQIILCTCPDHKTAENIATSLVREKLAACVNIIADVTSIYEWQGQTEKSQEHQLIIKSHHSKYTEIENKIKRLHPYELPEIIAVPIERGLPEYLQWINTCLSIK